MYKPTIPEPKDAATQELWLLWVVLDYLQAQGSSVTVPSSDIRAFILPYVEENKDSRDDVLRVLRRAKAIDVLNSSGNKNKRYFLTTMGAEIKEIYRRELEKRGVK